MKKNLFKIAMLGLLFSITSCISAANKTGEEGKVIHISYAEFNKKVANVTLDTFIFLGNRPCVVDFYATWCGPCKMLSPHLDDLAKKYAGKVDIYKVDVDKEKELGKVFGAFSIPLVIFMPTDEEPQYNRGYMSKEALDKAIRDVLLTPANSSK